MRGRWRGIIVPFVSKIFLATRIRGDRNNRRLSLFLSEVIVMDKKKKKIYIYIETIFEKENQFLKTSRLMKAFTTSYFIALGYSFYFFLYVCIFAQRMATMYYEWIYSSRLNKKEKRKNEEH